MAEYARIERAEERKSYCADVFEANPHFNEQLSRLASYEVLALFGKVFVSLFLVFFCALMWKGPLQRAREELGWGAAVPLEH